MDKLPLDILKIIFDLLDFKTKINLISICNYLRQNLYITDLYNIDRKYLCELTIPILKYRIFKNVISLDISYNNKIKNISFMKKLKKLSICGNNKIVQKSIKLN